MSEMSSVGVLGSRSFELAEVAIVGWMRVVMYVKTWPPFEVDIEVEMRWTLRWNRDLRNRYLVFVCIAAGCPGSKLMTL